jgi:hypothetical protein
MGGASTVAVSTMAAVADDPGRREEVQGDGATMVGNDQWREDEGARRASTEGTADQRQRGHHRQGGRRRGGQQGHPEADARAARHSGERSTASCHRRDSPGVGRSGIGRR